MCSSRLRAWATRRGAEVGALAPLVRRPTRITPRSRVATTPRSSPRIPLPITRHGVFIGIDAGSTTFKAALIAEDGSLLWSTYGNNNGDILGTGEKRIMADFFRSPWMTPAGELLVTIGHHGHRLRRGICCSRRCASTPAKSRRSRICAAPRRSCPALSLSWTSAART